MNAVVRVDGDGEADCVEEWGAVKGGGYVQTEGAGGLGEGGVNFETGCWCGSGGGGEGDEKRGGG